MPEGSAQKRYDALVPRRDSVARRARRYAALTIPSLLPPEGHNQTQELPEPNQGFGARLVTALASRLMTAILPPQQKSFRLQIPAEVLREQNVEKAPPEGEKRLTQVEDTIQAEQERQSWRETTNTTLQHLIVTGNAMEQMMRDNTIRTFRLDQYVVVRDPQGSMIEFIVQEWLAEDALPNNLAELAETSDSQGTAAPVHGVPSVNLLPLYTWGKWVESEQHWAIHQELRDTVVPDSEGTFTINPFNALRWVEVVGEDYGRGKAEEHIGDLNALDGLAKAVLDGAAMASRNITMIRPNAAGGLNLRRRLVKAPNGEFVIGNPEDVEMLQFQNQAGMQFVAAEFQALKTELGAAFLLNSASRRDAERVTAFELQMVIEEIESVLGGVFSSLANDISLRRLERLMLQMSAQNKLPELPEGFVEPIILTGFEALGREKDVQRVAQVLQLLNGLPPEQLEFVKFNVILGKAFNGIGIPDAVRTEEEVLQARQQRLADEATAQVVAQAAAGQGQQPQQNPQAATPPPQA